MRVVAGSARGVRLSAPPGRAVRPTSDRVKEAAFNALTSMGSVVDAVVVDLFAGSGALGIEALSRGAAHATFVDDAATSLEAVRENLTRAGVGDRSTVVRSDAVRWLAGATSPTPDLALLDPPYEFDRWDELLEIVTAPVLLIESDRVVAVPDRYGVLRERRYGTTVVLIAELQERRS